MNAKKNMMLPKYLFCNLGNESNDNTNSHFSFKSKRESAYHTFKRPF